MDREVQKAVVDVLLQLCIKKSIDPEDVDGLRENLSQSGDYGELTQVWRESVLFVISDRLKMQL